MIIKRLGSLSPLCTKNECGLRLAQPQNNIILWFNIKTHNLLCHSRETVVIFTVYISVLIESSLVLVSLNLFALAAVLIIQLFYTRVTDRFCWSKIRIIMNPMTDIVVMLLETPFRRWKFHSKNNLLKVGRLIPILSDLAPDKNLSKVFWR